jgi:hypothetical protein
MKYLLVGHPFESDLAVGDFANPVKVVEIHQLFHQQLWFSFQEQRDDG